MHNRGTATSVVILRHSEPLTGPHQSVMLRAPQALALSAPLSLTQCQQGSSALLS
jgi:hypothetical protein